MDTPFGFVRSFFACTIGIYKLNLARPEMYKIIQTTLKQVKKIFFSQGNFRTYTLLPVIFFFIVIAKWVAVLEIPGNMNKHATKNMSFNLSWNSCPSEVFKIIFFIEFANLTFWSIFEKISCVKSLRFLQCQVLL